MSPLLTLNLWSHSAEVVVANSFLCILPEKKIPPICAYILSFDSNGNIQTSLYPLKNLYYTDM